MDPYEQNKDGSAKDPIAYREALRADESRYALIKADDDLHEKVFGSDIEAFQELLRTETRTAKRDADLRQRQLANRSIDAQRTDATIPRDTVQLYEQMRESGLEYGPAFRLLRNVHVPPSVFDGYNPESSSP